MIFFRIFDKSIGEMTYDCSISLLNNDIVVQAVLCGELQTFTGKKLNDLIMMPRLDIDDMNGVTLYQYDIVKTSIGNFYINWCNTCKSYQCFYTSRTFGDICYACEGDLQWSEFIEEVNNKEVEIIGNMLENPERLNE